MNSRCCRRFRTAAHVATATLPRRYEGRGFDEWGLYQGDEFGNPARWLGRVEVVCVDSRWKGRGEDLLFPHDSALLQMTDGTPPPGVLGASTRHPARGDEVSVWGFPEGSVLFEARATVGLISEEWIKFQDALGRPIVGGHSGSPTLDTTGGVIGILVGGQRGLLACAHSRLDRAVAGRGGSVTGSRCRYSPAPRLPVPSSAAGQGR